jgi:multidrug efflux system outer membrane protein
MSRQTVSAALAVTALVAACTMEPAYHRPDLPVQSEWPEAPARAPGVAATEGAGAGAAPSAAPAVGAPSIAAAASAGPVPAADVGWRDFFTDPALDKLIEVALVNNRDARIAAINVTAARAQYEVQRAGLFPSISATGSETAERVPASVISAEEGGAGRTATGTVPGISPGGTVIRYFSAGIGFTSYELDLFGSVRSLNHEKLAQYFAYRQTQRSAIISLVAEVANAYLTVLADEALLKVTRDTYDSQSASYALTKMSYDHDISTRLDLRQAETSVDTARANIALYSRQLAQDQDALVLLLGAPIPADLPGATIDDEHLVEDLPAGLPSDLLQRRPDVLSAEDNLIAANASIGAARAAFFPVISLTGNLGTASGDLSGLFKNGSKAWTFQPQISLPIFAGGANIANLKVAKAQKALYVAQYEQAIQTAFREVSDALAGRGTLDDQLQAELALQAATQDSYQLSQLRFRNGVDNYLTVLDSQRSLYTAQQNVITLKLSRLQNLVTLYKALGGGWSEHTVPDPQRAAHNSDAGAR